MHKSPEDKAAYDRGYQLANKEKINARRRLKYATDAAARERVRQQAKRVYERTGREYHRRYREANKEQIRKRSRAWTYGMTVAEYDALYESQSGRCALCGINGEETPQGILSVDHCHADGRVRGLLCQQCNTELGVIEKRRGMLDAFLWYADHATPPTQKSGDSKKS